MKRIFYILAFLPLFAWGQSWEFNPGSLIVNGYKGIVSGQTHFVKTEKGLSAYFDGTNDYITYPDESYNGLGDKTFYGWAKYIDDGLYGNARIFLISTTNSRLEYSTSGSITISRNGSNFATSGSTLQENKWFFYCITSASDGTTNIYLGDNDNSPSLSGSADQNGGTPTDGGNFIVSDTGREWSGFISKISIHDEIFTADQIQDAYKEFLSATNTGRELSYKDKIAVNKPTSISDDGLVAAYNMIPNGNTLPDISGNGNDLTQTAWGTSTTLEGVSFPGRNNEGCFRSTSFDAFGVGDISLCFRLNSDIGRTGYDWVLSSAYSVYLGVSNRITFFRESNLITIYSVVPQGQDFTLVVTSTTLGASNFYVNGVLVHTDTTGVGVNRTTWNLGNRDAGTTRPFGGDINDVRIYNRILTEGEIQSYHNSFEKVTLTEDFSGNPALETHPIGWVQGTGEYKVGEELVYLNTGICLSDNTDSFTDVSRTGFSLASTQNNCLGGSSNISYIYKQPMLVEYFITGDFSNLTQVAFRSGYWGAIRSNSILPTEEGFHSEVFIPALTGSGPFAFLSNGEVNYTVSGLTITQLNPVLETGDKYLENTSAGTIAIPSSTAYGEWEFDIYKGADQNTSIVRFITDRTDPSLENGYLFAIIGTEAIYFQRRTGGSSVNIMATATSYVSNYTWYRIKITRTYDGEFTVWIKGGDFGTVYTLVDVSGGSGTNPVTDNTYTTSEYFVIDADAQDEVSRIIIKQ